LSLYDVDKQQFNHQAIRQLLSK